jgi:hypothetical protein
MTVDPENIKALLTTQFNAYGKGKDFYPAWKDVKSPQIASLIEVLRERHLQCGWSRMVRRPCFDASSVP